MALFKEYICPTCGYMGKAGGKKRGSGRLEWNLWLLFPLGLPYTLWRIFCKQRVCKSCSSEILIEQDSVVGQRLMAKWEENIGLGKDSGFTTRPIDKRKSTPEFSEKPSEFKGNW